MKEQTGVTKIIVDNICLCVNEITAEGFDHQSTTCQTLRALKCPLWLFLEGCRSIGKALNLHSVKPQYLSKNVQTKDGSGDVQGSHLSDIKRLAKQTKFSSTHCSNIKWKLYSTNAYLEHRGGTTGSFTSCSFSSPMMNSSWFLHKYSSNSREFCCIVSAQPVVFWRMQVYLHTYRYSACIYSSLCHFGMVLSLAYMEI